MAADLHRRRRSDAPQFIEADADIRTIADEIFERYVGELDVLIDGVPNRATFFNREYCPDYRVMELAGRLALTVNRRALVERDHTDGLQPLRVTIREIMLAALLHDLGKHHEDCGPFLALLLQTNLRDRGVDAARRERLLEIVRDTHCRKGPCMIDRLREAGRAELHNPFIVTTARRHGEDYEANRVASWWAREINVITIADDYDAITSEGPERAYKTRPLSAEDALELLHEGVGRGRYEPRLAAIFISDVLHHNTRTL